MGAVYAVPKLERLRQMRESHFLTQGELAERSGVSRQTINRLEQGEIEARMKTMRELAAALGVRPGALIGPILDDAFITFRQDVGWTEEQLAEWLGIGAEAYDRLANAPRQRRRFFLGIDGRPTVITPPAGWVRDLALKHGANVENLRTVLRTAD